MDNTVYTPTRVTYSELQHAFNHFNDKLFYRVFGKSLPHCLITLQRKSRTAGYYSPDKFHRLNGDTQVIDEIAMNPAIFAQRTIEQTLSTLVHEMAHQYQKHFGKPSRGNYHNTEWGTIMEQIGLMPSDTGGQSGKRTGQSMSHYIIEDGLFAKVCAELLSDEFCISWGDFVFGKTERGKAGNRSNRLKYRCPICEAQAWGKPELKILCGGEECDAAAMEQAD